MDHCTIICHLLRPTAPSNLSNPSILVHIPSEFPVRCLVGDLSSTDVEAFLESARLHFFDSNIVDTVDNRMALL
jgi:hypothetical protein